MPALDLAPANPEKSTTAATSPSFAWTDFYQEFADKLLTFKDDRATLIQHIRNVYEAIQIPLPQLDLNIDIVDIDPFTVFSLFNKETPVANRKKIISQFAIELNMQSPVPTSFDGTPILKKNEHKQRTLSAIAL